MVDLLVHQGEVPTKVAFICGVCRKFKIGLVYSTQGSKAQGGSSKGKACGECARKELKRVLNDGSGSKGGRNVSMVCAG